jgi:hypothetical protein
VKNRFVSWLMLAVWGSWIIAFQGILVAQTSLAAWLPDAGLVLLIACAGRFQKQDVPRAALLLALSRVAYSIEPPAAIFAAFLGTALLVHGIRSALEVNGPLLRTVVGGLAGWLFPAWLLIVQHARDGGEVALLPEILGLWRVAFTTALLALIFGPVFAHLPGLTPLRTRRW